jgi:hypothetical protein
MPRPFRQAERKVPNLYQTPAPGFTRAQTCAKGQPIYSSHLNFFCHLPALFRPLLCDMMTTELMNVAERNDASSASEYGIHV